MTPSSDSSLQTFTQRVREHQAGLRAFIRALGADELWVDDLAQEAFLIAYRRQSDFRADADFGRWLRGIARNLVANERRKKARQDRLLHASLSSALDESGGNEAPPFEETAETLAALRGCVAKLAPHHRDLLEQRYSRGENARELALRLNRTADSVRQNLTRIRLLVKTCVERQLAGNPP